MKLKKIFGKDKDHIVDYVEGAFEFKELFYVLIVSGFSDESGSFVYRALYLKNQFEKLGFTVNIKYLNELESNEDVSIYNLVILHRVAIDLNVESLIKRLDIKVPIIFDTDDLIFNEKHLKYQKHLKKVSNLEYFYNYELTERYRYIIDNSRYILVSTEDLQKEVLKMFPHKKVFVNRNTMGDDILHYSKLAYEEIHLFRKRTAKMIIGYASGSKTHDNDFAIVEDVILQILEKYPNVFLAIIGDLKVSSKISKYKDRVIFIPKLPWRSLPYWISRFDINIAPLESNIFTKSKSELKYFEAGIVHVPTIASDLPSFKYAIENGKNGFLAKNKKEWKQYLELLIKDSRLRQKIGDSAYKDVMQRYITSKNAINLSSILSDIKISENKDDHKLTINWIMQSPLIGVGGYSTIFRLINLLTNFNHNIYIERIEHLENKSKDYVSSYIHKGWGNINAQIYFEEEGYKNSDICIATAWNTSYKVRGIKNTKRKIYFIQDLEYLFYKEDKSEYRLAKESYTLNMYNITLGNFIEHNLKNLFPKYLFTCIPFGIDNKTYIISENTQKKYDIIFYARPNTPRRKTELGIESLNLAYKADPKLRIALFGSINLKNLDNIKFKFIDLGILSPQNLNKEFNKSKLGMVFSDTNISLVPFEMILAGLPVIQNDNESTREFFKHNKNSYLVKEDAHTISNSILSLLQDDKLRNNIKDTAYKQFKNLSWENSAKKLEDLLTKDFI